MAALSGLEFDCLEGHNIMIKRPDIGSNRYCDAAVEMHFGVIRNGNLIWDGSIPATEVIPLLEKFYGYAGQWR